MKEITFHTLMGMIRAELGWRIQFQKPTEVFETTELFKEELPITVSSLEDAIRFLIAKEDLDPGRWRVLP